MRDAGDRSAVTGGAQMNGFVHLISKMLQREGIGEDQIFCERFVEIPGWFRPEKKWDLLLVVDKCLIACLELKSHVRRSDERVCTFN